MGNIPALVAKPTMVTNSTASISGVLALTQPASSVPPAANTGVVALAVKKNTPIRPIMAPAMEYSRYLRPAATASLLMECSTMATESSVIISKKRYMVTSVPAKHRPISAARVNR